MTNRQFYVSNKALAEAFKKFCKGTEGANCDYCAVQKEIYEKGIKTSDCKIVWLDMPHCEEPRVSGIVSAHCTQCKKWETALHGSVNKGFCRDGVRRMDPDKIDGTCVWFDLKKPSTSSESADTPVLRPDRRRVAPCNCSHHGEPILGSDHGRCNHPANSATVTTCGFWNAADCFRFAENENTKTVDTPPPAPSAPASESDPNGLHPSDPGAKLDSGKNRIGLVLDGFAPAIVEVGRVGTYGASKYSPNGWKSVEGAKRRYMDALMRHLFAHLIGEKIDKESGLSHLAHAAWNVLALLTFEVKGGGE